MNCPDCKDGFYYPLTGPREKCTACGGTCTVSAMPAQGSSAGLMMLRLGKNKMVPEYEQGKYHWYRRGEVQNTLHTFDGFKARYEGLRNVMVPFNSGGPFVDDQDPKFPKLYDEMRKADSLFRKNAGPPGTHGFYMEVTLNCDWISEPVYYLLTPITAKFLVLGHPLTGMHSDSPLDPQNIGKMCVFAASKFANSRGWYYFPVVKVEA